MAVVVAVAVAAAVAAAAAAGGDSGGGGNRCGARWQHYFIFHPLDCLEAKLCRGRRHAVPHTQVRGRAAGPGPWLRSLLARCETPHCPLVGHYS